MIQNRSFLKLADNSGAKICQCIKVFATSKAVLGSCILVSVRQTKPQTRIKKGEMFKAIIVRANKIYPRSNGLYLRCFENSIILLNSKEEFYGTRLIGPITNELRKKKLTKILSLTNSIV